MPTNLVATITKVFTPELTGPHRIGAWPRSSGRAEGRYSRRAWPACGAHLSCCEAGRSGKTERHRRRPTTGDTHQHRQRHRRIWAEGSDRHRSWHSLFAPRRKHHVGAHKRGEQVCRDRRWRVEGAHGAPRPARHGRARTSSNGRGASMRRVMARLLESQKDNIANALPSGFAKYLSGTGILDNDRRPREPLIE